MRWAMNIALVGSALRIRLNTSTMNRPMMYPSKERAPHTRDCLGVIRSAVVCLGVILPAKVAGFVLTPRGAPTPQRGTPGGPPKIISPKKSPPTPSPQEEV